MLLIIILILCLIVCTLACGYMLVAIWDSWVSFRITRNRRYSNDMIISLVLMLIFAFISTGLFSTLDGALYAYFYIQGS